MKKTLSYILVLFILITMIPATAVPVQADTTTDDLILDFTNDTTISDFGFTANTVDGENGAKWEYANLKSSEKYLYFHHNDIVTNWKAYTAIKIRLHFLDCKCQSIRLHISFVFNVFYPYTSRLGQLFTSNSFYSSYFRT